MNLHRWFQVAVIGIGLGLCAVGLSVRHEMRSLHVDVGMIRALQLSQAALQAHQASEALTTRAMQKISQPLPTEQGAQP